MARYRLSVVLLYALGPLFLFTKGHIQDIGYNSILETRAASVAKNFPMLYRFNEAAYAKENLRGAQVKGHFDGTETVKTKFAYPVQNIVKTNTIAQPADKAQQLISQFPRTGDEHLVHGLRQQPRTDQRYRSVVFQDSKAHPGLLVDGATIGRNGYRDSLSPESQDYIKYSHQNTKSDHAMAADNKQLDLREGSRKAKYIPEHSEKTSRWRHGLSNPSDLVDEGKLYSGDGFHLSGLRQHHKANDEDSEKTKAFHQSSSSDQSDHPREHRYPQLIVEHLSPVKDYVTDGHVNLGSRVGATADKTATMGEVAQDTALVTEHDVSRTWDPATSRRQPTAGLWTSELESRYGQTERGHGLVDNARQLDHKQFQIIPDTARYAAKRKLGSSSSQRPISTTPENERYHSLDRNSYQYRPDRQFGQQKQAGHSNQQYMPRRLEKKEQRQDRGSEDDVPSMDMNANPRKSMDDNFKNVQKTEEPTMKSGNRYAEQNVQLIDSQQTTGARKASFRWSDQREQVKPKRQEEQVDRFKVREQDQKQLPPSLESVHPSFNDVPERLLLEREAEEEISNSISSNENDYYPSFEIQRGRIESRSDPSRQHLDNSVVRYKSVRGPGGRNHGNSWNNRSLYWHSREPAVAKQQTRTTSFENTRATKDGTFFADKSAERDSKVDTPTSKNLHSVIPALLSDAPATTKDGTYLYSYYGFPYNYLGFPYDYRYAYSSGFFPVPDHESFECPGNGLFYRDESSFYSCSDGSFRVQPCAPGTMNKAAEFYRTAAQITELDFCAVNLIAMAVPHTKATVV